MVPQPLRGRRAGLHSATPTWLKAAKCMTAANCTRANRKSNSSQLAVDHRTGDELGVLHRVCEAGGEVVEYKRCIPDRDQSFHRVRGNMAGAADDENLLRNFNSWTYCRMADGSV